MGQEISKKIPYLAKVLFFFSSVSCLIFPMLPLIPESAQERIQPRREIACRVLRLTNESKILHYVVPEYPGNSGKIKGDMLVFLKADVDQEGRVKDVRCPWPHLLGPSFNEAAGSAVRQWVFEPVLVDGQAVEVTHAIKIVFQVKRKDAVAKAWLYPDEFRVCEMRKQNVKVEDSPKLLHWVDPIQLESARLPNKKGELTMEILISESGEVEAVLLWKSIRNLDKAAVEAISQWVFEPLIVDNTPYKQIVPLNFRFH